MAKHRAAVEPTWRVGYWSAGGAPFVAAALAACAWILLLVFLLSSW